MSPSYFLAGAAALIASWTLSGCRFGNHTEQAESPDKTSGYYSSQPQTLSYCSNHTETTCANAPTNQIPTLIGQVMTNPVALVVRDLTTGDAALTSPYGNGSSALPVSVDTSTGNLSFIGNTVQSVAWKDPACTQTVYIEQGGQAQKTAQATMVGTLRVVGRISLDVQIITTFDGNCGPTMQVLAACYSDATQCGGTDDIDNANLQSDVHAMFKPYIDAGAMTAGDIATTTSVAYEIVYQ